MCFARNFFIFGAFLKGVFMNRFGYAALFVVMLAFGQPLCARDLEPNKTHAVLTVTFTNEEDVPQAKKKLMFVGQNDPKKKITVTTDSEGEVTFHIPREDSYTIFCESLTGYFECGNTPYVSTTASTGGITVTFDDTRVELTGVTFKAGSAELEPNSLATLDAAIAGLKRNPKARIELQGHTSSEGDDEMNQRLSEARAYAVLQYMKDNGIDWGRLSASGYGSSQPRATNSTEEGRKKNRRIELRVLNEDEVPVEYK